MEWVTYFMIVLIALASCFGWPVLINSEDSDGSADSIDKCSGRSVFSDLDHPYLTKEWDGPGGPLGRPNK